MELRKQEFIQLIDKNKGIIRSLCKIYYKSTEDQKDAFQDIILQLWKSMDSFRGESEISTWIYRISLNTILLKIRREKKSVSAEPIEAHNPIANAKADDQLELLSLMMQFLKPIDKAIVVLHLEGYKNKEIANMLKLSPTNVNTRFNRLKAQLKSKFQIPTHATQRF